MVSLVDLLRELLESGSIEITVSVKLVEPDQPREGVTVTCEWCGKWSRTYSKRSSAMRGLRAHYGHCSAYAQQSKAPTDRVPSWIVQNGANAED